MPTSLLDYHFLEDGELNRLWYEENDPRARDAFMQRWWLGGDPVAGKDLLSHYHTLFMHRCYSKGILAEEHMAKVFRAAVRLLVTEYPADPIEKFEDVWIPFVDRAIDATKGEIATPSTAPIAEQKKKIEESLRASGAHGELVREWLTSGTAARSEAECENLLDAVKQLLIALDGEAAKNHPIVRTPEPEPSKLDPSVAVPHFHAQPLFQYAFAGGTLTKRENEHIDWCQPCRQRCLGALLVLRRMREILGGDVPKLPEISPEFDQILQSESPGVPKIDASKRTKKAESGGSKTGLIIGVLLVVAIGIAVAMMLAKK